MKTRIEMFEKNSIEILKAEGSYSLPLHSHECFCFGIIKEGSVCFKIGDKEKLLSKGMGYIIPANVGITIKANQNYSHIIVCLKNEIKDYFMKYIYKGYFLDNISVESIDKYCNKFIENGNAENFLKDIYKYIESAQDKSIHYKYANEEIIEMAKEYIKNYIYYEFSLDDICSYIHISKYHFIRLFKKFTGVTPNQYYIQAKLFAAKQLFKENEQETKVAAELNFTDQSYLCNLFKKRMGISIRDFKKNYQQI